jgi:tryptophan-rich sensory protein
MRLPAAQKDERTVAVENASYRWAYLLFSFGLLAIVAYRDFVWRQSSWELLALVVLSGLVTTLYQGFHRVLSRRWATVVTVTVLLAAALALAITLLR